MIEVEHKTYNKLTQALIEHRKREAKKGKNYRYPFLFLVASKGENGIISKSTQLRENSDVLEKDENRRIEHCYRMSNLSAREFSQKAIKIMRGGYVVRGLVRIGEFIRSEWTHQDDGNVERELYAMSPEMLFITIQPTGISVRRNCGYVGYKIVVEKE